MEEDKLASVGTRFMASLLDGLLILVVAYFVGVALGLTSPSAGEGTIAFFTTLVYLGYYWVPTALSGQTPGKRLMGIRVVNAQGEPPGFARAAMRELLGKAVSTLVLYLGYLMALFHPEKRALHDLIGGTWVVVAPSRRKSEGAE